MEARYLLSLKNGEDSPIETIIYAQSKADAERTACIFIRQLGQTWRTVSLKRVKE